MAGHNLTVDSSLSCPHGGTVAIISANARANAGGAPLATADDTFTIGGCGYTLQDQTPSPCVRVQWLLTEERITVGGAAALDDGSVGLCLAATNAPQGAVVINNTQSAMQGQ